MRYRYKKEYLWNSDIAYFAGLMASDGCMLNNRRHLNLTSKDVDLLETVRSILGLKGPVKAKPNGFGGVGYFIQFSNVALYDFLYEAGIEPAKSKTIGKIKIPDDYYHDFLRGYFDGDGTIYGNWDRRWASSLMYYTGFVSASRPFLEWLMGTNERLAGVTGGTIHRGTRAFVLRYAKSDSQKLFVAMYSDMNAPHLHRKRDKFIDFLRTDPYASKELLARVP